MRARNWMLGVGLALCIAGPAGAQALKLRLMSSGASNVVGYAPQRLALSAVRPAFVTKTPGGLVAPKYAVLRMGPAESRREYAVLLDEPEQADSRLWVDTNGDGDLTNDPPAEWQKREMAGSGGKTMVTYFGGATVLVQSGSKPTPLHLGFYKFDRNDPMRAALKDTLLFYADYALQGTLTLGSEVFPVMLVDNQATGDFRSAVAAEGAKAAAVVRLLIDRNQDGRFASVGETFDASKPFTLNGTTYEVRLGDAFGTGARLVKSSVTVAEVPAPPDLRVGKVAPSFEAKTTDGAVIQVPGSYKGKLVLLDFWATWCGPCVGEIPGLVKAYEKYHGRGFEVLGVSLDQANMAERLAAFTREKGMPWPQIYDGKYWRAEIAQKFGIDSIPAPFLVDGTTGRILARGAELRGANLEKTLEEKLSSRR